MIFSFTLYYKCLFSFPFKFSVVLLRCFMFTTHLTYIQFAFFFLNGNSFAFIFSLFEWCISVKRTSSLTALSRDNYHEPLLRVLVDTVPNSTLSSLYICVNLWYTRAHTDVYSHALHKAVSVNNEPHVQQWSHKIIMELNNSRHLVTL